MASSKGALPKSAHKALPVSANLANLLPTGTVFAFQAVIPSLSNNGRCELAHKYMTLGIIIICSLACFLSSFTDSFVGKDGKFYYGIAIPKGLYVFNDEHGDGLDVENDLEDRKMLEKYRLTAIDFVHACCSLTLFLVMACSSFDVQGCFFPEPAGPNADAVMTNLPLLAGILASGLFMLFPTKRRGIGYAEKPDWGDRKKDKQGQKTGDKETLGKPKVDDSNYLQEP